MEIFQEFRNDKGEIERDNIKKIIPYGDSFLLIDKVLKLEEDRIIAEKKIEKNDPIINSHFVDFPIYPGALIVEGMGQAGTLLVRSKISNHNDKYVLAYRIDSATFKKPVFPGDKITYEIVYRRGDETRAQLTANSIVNNITVAQCDMTVAIVNKKEFRGHYGR